MPSKEQLRKFRAELSALIPWVTVLKRPKRDCDALTNAWYKLGFKTRRDTPVKDRGKYRCKHKGIFHFRGLKGDWGGITGTYCEIHLRATGIFGTMREEERYQRWCEKNAFTLNALRAKYGLPPVPTEGALRRMNNVKSG